MLSACVVGKVKWALNAALPTVPGRVYDHVCGNAYCIHVDHVALVPPRVNQLRHLHEWTGLEGDDLLEALALVILRGTGPKGYANLHWTPAHCRVNDPLEGVGGLVEALDAHGWDRRLGWAGGEVFDRPMRSWVAQGYDWVVRDG